MKDKNRQSGRTTRLVTVAKYLARQGNKVIIVAANNAHRRLFFSRITSAEENIEICSPDEHGGFCWETMSFRGYPENTIYLVDHWAIESRFSKMLQMLKAFDL